MSDAAAMHTVRRFLLVILCFGAAGTLAELLLLAHFEDATQWIPIALTSTTLLLSGVIATRPSRGLIRIFQAVMALMIVSGGVGMYLHLSANMEFQLEMDATLRGFALLKKSAVAKAPPALAPGVMTQLGLLGLLYTFKHPQLVAPTL